MKRADVLRDGLRAALGSILALAVFGTQVLFAQSLDIPAKKWGTSFGNSREFAGLRFNFRDSQVRRITGLNVSLWQPRKNNKDSVVKGISLGLIPRGGEMAGLQLGILGPASEKKMTGLNIGFVGAGEVLQGITIAGLGAGAGKKLLGLAICGLAAGAPEVRGTAIGGAVIGGQHLAGAFFAGGVVLTDRNGRLSGLAVSPVTYLRGRLNGLAIGIVNYAWSLEKGAQIGFVNIIRSNPKGLRVLPVFNTAF